MTIAVAFKWAANPQDASVDADGVVDWSRAKPALSEYDPVAIEVGRRLADETGAELVGITVGGPEAEVPLARKSVLARGVDRLVTICDDALRAADSAVTAALLAAALQRLQGVDLVLTGDASVDAGAKLVPPLLGAHLGWPVLSEVTSIHRQGETWLVERDIDTGTQVVAVQGPLVVATAITAAVPRVPGMKDTLAAGKKRAESWAPASLEAPRVAAVTVTGCARPRLAARAGTVLTGSAAEIAGALVAGLRAGGSL